MSLKPGPGRTEPAVLAFFALLALSAFVPLFFPYFIAQDGPTHIATGDILRRLLVGNASGPLQVFEWVPFNTTNSFIHYIAAALTSICDVALADRVVAAALIWLLPFSAWYLAKQYGLADRWILLALVPFGFSFSLTTGNYNTIAGIGFAILALAVLVKHDFRLRWHGGGRPFALLLWLAIWAHPLGAGLAALFVGLVLMRRLAFPRMAVPAAFDLIRRLLLASLPALAMTLPFLAHKPASTLIVASGPIDGFMFRFKNMVGLHQLYASIETQIVMCLALAALVWSSVLMAAATRAAKPQLQRTDEVLLIAGASVLIVLFAPNHLAGSDFLIQRLDGLPAMFLIIWAASVAPGRRVAQAQRFAVVAAALGFAMTNAIGIARINHQQAIYASIFNQIPPGSVVVPINAGRIHEMNANFLHLHHLFAARQDVLALNNWNASYAGFPIRFIAKFDPTPFFVPYRSRPADYAGYAAATGIAIDYVVMWEQTAWFDEPAGTSDLHKALAGSFTQVARQDAAFGHTAVLYARDGAPSRDSAPRPDASRNNPARPRRRSARCREPRRDGMPICGPARHRAAAAPRCGSDHARTGNGYGSDSRSVG